MRYKSIFIIPLLLLLATVMRGQSYELSGKIVSDKDGSAIEFASILIKDNGLWAVSDQKGQFTIRQLSGGRHELSVQCLGYATRTMPININRNVKNMTIKLKEENLQLDEVEVVAQRRTDLGTTSYTVGRQALDNQQVLNLSDVASLLPGGKTVNSTLMDDSRLGLRSASGEKGNSTFGTAIEVDGVRVQNNATMGETAGASTRNIGTANIESVEIVPGIPSVEYGDLTNGIVRVNTRRGRTPYIVEGKINQHTRQIALSKGFELGRNVGLLNASFEHARSFSDAASPHTAYQRNAFSINYNNVLMRSTMPLTLTLGITGNVGGYNSEADPDEDLDDYTKQRDNAFSAHFSVQWLLNKKWLTSLLASGSVSYSDRRYEAYANKSSASTQPLIHAMTEGYNIAEDYDANPNAAIVLGPTGYWYEKRFNDSKPLSYNFKLKAEQNSRWGWLSNHVMVGAELSGSHNGGRGTYYDDMSYAPTWREYRYDDLPTMLNIAPYAEDRLSAQMSKRSELSLTMGLRGDITSISGSDYGTASSASPRLNARYVWRGQPTSFVRQVSVHAGWGKAVKLPSFQVLYPSPSYSDRLAFSSTSDAQNRSYYAYYTIPTSAVYNPNLRWQYSHQTDVGIDIDTKIARVSLSAWYSRSFDSYMATSVFTPFTYKYTTPTAVQQCGIPVSDRQFTISPEGVVTVSDATGRLAPVTLEYQERNTYTSNTKYVNSSPLKRWGLEWIVDFAQIRALRTQIRLDGNYYCYNGTDQTMYADVPLGLNTRMTDGRLYQYIGYYTGGNSTSTSYDASASVSNGFESRQCNLNTTITTHIPKIRLIVALRVEASLYNYHHAKCELPGRTRGYEIENGSDYFGQPYNGSENKYVVVYPDYYSTWEAPDERIPFAERFRWAQENDRALFNDLSRLVVRSNYLYTLNPNRISAYYSANFSVTKEIGDHVSVSFYANNFFNTMKTVHQSQTDLDTSLFGSGYVPSFYYGLSLKLKI